MSGFPALPYPNHCPPPHHHLGREQASGHLAVLSWGCQRAPPLPPPVREGSGIQWLQQDVAGHLSSVPSSWRGVGVGIAVKFWELGRLSPIPSPDRLELGVTGELGAWMPESRDQEGSGGLVG